MAGRRRLRRGHRRHARRGRKARHHRFNPYKMKHPKGVIVRSLNYPLPPTFETTLQNEFSGLMAVGSLTNAQTTNANGYGICAIPAWIVNPFGTAFRGLPLITAAGLFATTTSIFNPAGMKNLLLNSSTNTGLYQLFRPYGAELMLDILPSGVTDSLTVSLAPSTDEDVVPAATSAGVSAIMQMPGGKQIFAKLNQPNVIKSRLNVGTLFGASRAMVNGSNGYAATYTGGPPVNVAGWVIGVSTASNAVTAAAIVIHVRLRVWGRFEAMSTVGILDT